MKNKRHILYCTFFLLAFVKLFPQGGKRDKIEALRVGYITKELSLSSDEAQKFWPVYDEYTDKLRFARKEFRDKTLSLNIQNSDKEAQEYLDAEFLLKQREFALYKEYYERFKKILPLKKVAVLRQAEEGFKKELLKQLQGKTND